MDTRRSAMHFLCEALFVLGLMTAPAQARDLQVEVEVQHVSGLLDMSEVESLLADERLVVEAHYQPLRLVEGDTARRERVMPMGSRLFAIPRQVDLRGAQVERSGRSLRVRVAEIHPEHDGYRLSGIRLRVPIARGPGRPQPSLEVSLMDALPKSGAREEALFGRYGAFDLGLRARARWSGSQEAAVAATPACHYDVEPLGGGQYRFRPRHRLSGLFEFLSPVVSSDPPSRPPAGQRSVRLSAPYPAPLEGWTLSRNHLVQLQAGGQVAERFSLYGEQTGAGRCRRTLAYDALFAGGRLVALKHSVNESECRGEDVHDSRSVEASWLDDGSLARYLVSTPRGSQVWDGFLAAQARCSTGAAPPADEVQALSAELHRIREAFLR